MHHLQSFSALLAGAALASACVIPPGTLSNNIPAGFGILIQNPTFPLIHNRLFNLMVAGGGDKHLFLDPIGDRAFNLDLKDGAIEQGIIHAVIGGEYDELDNSTKMFMTERGDPKAIFQPTYGCDPDTDALQVRLVFQLMQNQPFGGLICVREASGGRGLEFRYQPPGNTGYNPLNPCMPVSMVIVNGTNFVTSTTSTSTSSTSSVSVPTTLTTTTSTSSAPTSTPTGPLINGIWGSIGCYTESTTGRALNAKDFAADTMTLEACATFCTGYKYFGTEYARECFCGNTFSAGSVPAPAAQCNFQCKGNPLQICGAGSRLSVYTSDGVVLSSSSSSSSVSSTSSSSSSSQSSTSTSSTSSSSVSSSSTSTSSTSSSSTSSTTSTPSALPYTDMISKGYAFQGCAPEERRATDGPGRVLNGPVLGDDAQTNEKCMDFCTAQGYAYAGTEWSRECWCGNTVAPGRVPATTLASLAACNFRCSGAQTQYCGGDAWLSLYKKCPAGGPCVNVVFT